MADTAVPSLEVFKSLMDMTKAVEDAENIGSLLSLQNANAADKELKSSSSDSSSKKKKRTQFTSCDACRLRKVKCIVENGQTECRSCNNKNIACTRVFSSAHAHGKGKRIDLARDQFGYAKHAGTRDLQTGTSSHISASPPTQPPQSFTVYKLNEKVLCSKALSAFMHAYETDVASAIPALDYARLIDACKEVDFDIGRLDELDRVLCIAAAAVTASVQQADRKFGFGQSAIMVSEPWSTKKDLEVRVTEEADRLGILRKPCIRTLEVLRLFCILSSGDASRQLRRSHSYRAYEQALVEHLRSLAEERQISEQKIGEYFWSIILGDSFAAALSGRSPSFTAEDVENFASFIDYSTEGMLFMISQIDHSSRDAGFGLIFAAICRICRSFYDRVTSVRARRRPFVDVEMLQEIPPEMERINVVMGVCEQKLDSLYGKENWPEPLGYWGRIVRFLHTFIMVMALDELETAIVKELSGNISLQRLHILQQTMEKLQLRTIEELKANMGWEPRPGSARILATIDGLLAFFSVLRMRRIFKLPSIEEGGCGGSWTLEEKLANAKYYMKVCEYLGFAVPEIAEELPLLRTELSSLDQKTRNMSSQVPGIIQTGLASQQPQQCGTIAATTFPGFPTFPDIPSSGLPPSGDSLQLPAMEDTYAEIGSFGGSGSLADILFSEQATPHHPDSAAGLAIVRDPYSGVTDLRPTPSIDSTSPSSGSTQYSEMSPELQLELFLHNLGE